VGTYSNKKAKDRASPPKIKPIPETWYWDECAKKFVRVLASDFGVPPPKVMYIDKEIYREEEDKRTYGLYHISNKIIQLFRGSNGSTVLHEFIHYLQDLTVGIDPKRFSKEAHYHIHIEDEADVFTDVLWPVYESIARRIYEGKNDIPPVAERRAELCKRVVEFIFTTVADILEKTTLEPPEKYLRDIEHAVETAKDRAEMYLRRLAIIHMACKGKMMPEEFPEGDLFGDLVKIAKEIKRLAESYLSRTGIDRLRLDEIYRIQELNKELKRKRLQLAEELIRT
jgi:hypothetical protein